MIHSNIKASNQMEICGSGIPSWVVRSVSPKEDYKLELLFADGRKGLYDVKPLLTKKIYQPLNNKALFMMARVFGDSVIWTDEIDIAPEHLYAHSVFEEDAKQHF